MKEVVVLAGAGDLGRYVCEEFLESTFFSVVILTRNPANKWFTSYPVEIRQTDYTSPSVLKVLDEVRASTLISFLNIPDPTYITVHSAILQACKLSKTCKRLIPSEYIGNSEAFSDKPDYYATTRLPFREMLRAQSEVEWTLFNCGWIMDYFLPSSKTYMKPIKEKFPVDPEAWTACIRGTGQEIQSWTSARDIGRAIVQLCATKNPPWEPWTYTAGEWSTFQKAVETMEEIYGMKLQLSKWLALVLDVFLLTKTAYTGRSMPKTFRSFAAVWDALAKHAKDEPISEELEMAQVEEMMVMGYLACPKVTTLKQRKKYFKSIEFMGLKDFLEHAEDRAHV
ncbi:MAG: hypothetical protein Q9167_001184 [Letrouitia subvulpina]